jgi:hypothetical protein
LNALFRLMALPFLVQYKYKKHACFIPPTTANNTFCHLELQDHQILKWKISEKVRKFLRKQLAKIDESYSCLLHNCSRRYVSSQPL